MSEKLTLEFKFVEFIPQKLNEGIVYISVEHATAVHNCVCGCGNAVVTPLSPVDWKLIYDGDSISLSPSIGNWSFPCESHYWIIHNKIRWARKWSSEEIQAGRDLDRISKNQYYSTRFAEESDDNTDVGRKH